MSKAKFKVGDYILVDMPLYDEGGYRSEVRYYFILRVIEDTHYGLQYRCLRFVDGVAVDYTTTVGASLLDKKGKIIAHIDLTPIEEEWDEPAEEEVEEEIEEEAEPEEDDISEVLEEPDEVEVEVESEEEVEDTAEVEETEEVEMEPTEEEGAE